MVVSDIDFILERNALNSSGQPINDNWSFLTHAIDLLSRDQKQLDIPVKTMLKRPFSIIETRRKKALEPTGENVGMDSFQQQKKRILGQELNQITL